MDRKYLKLVFKRQGQQLEMGAGCTIKLTETPRGIEAPKYSVHTASNATSDGSSLSGKKVDDRPISVYFGIDSAFNMEFYREQLIHFFNPKYTYELIVTYGYSQMMIECELEGFEFDSQSSLWGDLLGTIDLLCLKPYFNDLDNFGRNIASITPMFAFPLFIPKDKGRIMGYRTLKKEVSVPNKGDVETGLEIVMTATRGAVTNPKITKVSTGEFIEVFVEMEKGDVLKIDTNEGNKIITLNGKNVFKEKNKLSTFFSIDVGDNLVSYDAEVNYTNLDVRLYYTPKYLGI